MGTITSASSIMTLVALLFVTGCRALSPEGSTPVLEAPPNPPSSSEQESQESHFSPSCDTWAVEELAWRELESPSSTEKSDDSGVQVKVSRYALPEGGSPRYNAAVEICPGFMWIINHVGESLFVSVERTAWAEGPVLTTSGSTESLSLAGVSSGGPVWGFRDAVLHQDSLWLSDAVIDLEKSCTRVDVHEIAVSEILAGTPDSRVIYSSDPCVDYQEPHRVSAPIKTHLGGALAYDSKNQELFLTIGDYHLGASTIGQAVKAGIAATQRDYAVLRDPSAATSAVVAIANPSTAPSARIYAKGLRNSLGLAFTPDGNLWLSDHGPNGGDELNLLIEGSDYGWPLRAQGRPYDRSSWPEDPGALPAPWLDFFNAELSGATDPLFVWTPAIAPSELALYAPITPQLTNYAGSMLLGSLRGEALIRLSISEDSTITESRLALGERIRDLTVLSQGPVALLTDSRRLLIISELQN